MTQLALQHDNDNDVRPAGRSPGVLPDGGFEEFVWEVRHKLNTMAVRLSEPLAHDSDQLFEVTRDLYALRSVSALLQLPHCATVAGRCGLKLRELARRGTALTHLDRNAVVRVLRVLGQMYEMVLESRHDGDCRGHMLRALSILEG